MKKQNGYWDYVVLALFLLLALVCLISASHSSNQAALSFPIPLTLEGEYSYDGTSWMPLTKGEKLSARQGDIMLRGHLNMEVPEGISLSYYRNHVGISWYHNGVLWMQDAVSELTSYGIALPPSMCGREWDSVLSPGITAEDTIEIHIHNPHAYGNGTAYRDFLNTLCCGLRQQHLEPYGQPFRILGGVFAILALLLTGAAISAALLRIHDGVRLLTLGLLSLFAGGFFVYDSIDISFQSNLMVLNTYARQLAMMLAVACLGYLICDALTGSRCRVAKAAVLASVVLNCSLILLSFTGVWVIFDTYVYWAVSQWLLCPLLAACSIAQLREEGPQNKLILISGTLLCTTILLDLAGVGGSILSQGTCSKGMFCLLCALYLLVAAKNIAVNYGASLRVQVLEQELRDSRISIMLSQLQPHFLFNVLNSIYYLCGTDPNAAQNMVDKFSTYLRNNLDSLEQKTMIPFQKELDHIQTYLELEKLRFGAELEVRYDIPVNHFLVPVLSVQPLVENAVKHGIGKKEDGGVLTLSTREEPACYVITVTDTGIGFDPAHCGQDGKIHIGIENVRQRLKHMAGGTLQITSVPGEGTTAVITLPKGKK